MAAESPSLASVPRLDGLGEEQAKAVLRDVLGAVYRAFQMGGEEAAYDLLAQSLEGELLDDIYLQQRRAFLRRAKGQAGEGRVDGIEVLASRIRETRMRPIEYEIDARWIAHGTVAHFGHAHVRDNLYQARLTLRPDGGRWRITALAFPDSQEADFGAAS